MQRPKDSVRRAILSAAMEEFAQVGFGRATLAGISVKAGTSIGNLYKYFPSKGALFDTAIPRELVQELGDLIQRRVEALGVEVDINTLSGAHPYRLASEQLLEFTLAHRPQLLFLLTHAEATAYASFAENVVRNLTKLAQTYATRAYPATKMTRSRRRALARIYRGFLGSIASILAEEVSATTLRVATEQLTIYHLAGLRAFFAAAGPPVPPRDP